VQRSVMMVRRELAADKLSLFRPKMSE